MTDETLSREVALRIGLAARELDNADASTLLRVLSDVAGLPPTAARLAKLKPKHLRQGAGGELAGSDPNALEAACAILNGERERTSPLPSPEPYAEGDIPDSLRVACASNEGEWIDGHFGSCRYFLIYQVSADEMRLIDVRTTEPSASQEDKNAYRAGLIRDAQVLFVASIGGPAAAKVVRAGVHPVKHPQGGEARRRLEELQAKIASSPPPWLAKAMGRAATAAGRDSLDIGESGALLDEDALDEIVALISSRGLNEDTVDILRECWPAVRFNYCLDDEIGQGEPIRSEPGFNLYLVDRRAHCAALTSDFDAAFGVVLAEVEDDEV